MERARHFDLVETIFALESGGMVFWCSFEGMVMPKHVPGGCWASVSSDSRSYVAISPFPNAAGFAQPFHFSSV